MLRRLKSDVLSQLPPKRRQRIEVTVDDRIMKQVKKILGGFLEDIEVNEGEKESFIDNLI